jgi:hypothetical protein
MNRSKRSRRGWLPAFAGAALLLVLVPAASAAQGQTQYPDAAGDNGSAPDVTGVTVASDRTSGQILFRITGTNLSPSADFPTFLFIDSDANPATGDTGWNGADYAFYVDSDSYDFSHWDGSQWADTSYATVHVTGGGNSLLVSVNKCELGNTSEFNFSVDTLDAANKTWDDAPDLGTFNYSLAAAGPDIVGMLLQTKPTFGPKAGKQFVLSPLGLKLPPSGAVVDVLAKPDSYTCRATLKGRALSGGGTGGCTYQLLKTARGKQLKVVLTVTYEGATKSFSFPFRVS